MLFDLFVDGLLADTIEADTLLDATVLAQRMWESELYHATEWYLLPACEDNTQELGTLRYKRINVDDNGPLVWGFVWQCATMAPSAAAARNATLVRDRWIPCDGSEGEY